MPAVERMLKDEDADVRAAAVRALAALAKEDASTLMRRHLGDPEPRVAVTAAVVLADSGHEADAHAAEATLQRLIDDTRDAAARRAPGSGRRARAHQEPELPPAARSADVRRRPRRRAAGHSQRGTIGRRSNRCSSRGSSRCSATACLKPAARDVLVGYGDDVLDALAYFLMDRDENVWVRRHIPATLALIPTQRSMDVLLDALDEPDGFLRYKVVTAIEKLRRDHPDLVLTRSPIEGARAQGELALLPLPDAAVQPRPARRGDAPIAAGAGARGQARAHARPHLPAAGADLSLEGRRRRALHDRAQRRPDARRRHRVHGQPARRRDPQARDAAHRRRARWSRRCGTPTSSSRPGRATSRTRSRSSCTTKTTRSWPPPPFISSRSGSSGRWSTTSSSRWPNARSPTGTSSKPRRGPSPRTGCRTSAAISGWSRCPPSNWRNRALQNRALRFRLGR